jgi:alkylation response protein AidB-like acyl-CoA dehydrogenase
MDRDAAEFALPERHASVLALLAQDDDGAFRIGVEQWLTDALRTVAGARYGHASIHTLEFRRRWEDHLCAAGWSGQSWPRAYGGSELTLPHQAIFHEACARAEAPLPLNMVGHGILGPTLLLHGSEAQKRRFLPPLLANRDIWCQGYSEPEAGSDLAALRTTATREGDVYRLRGHKIWTSYAQVADWCFLLARTAPDLPRHRGISFLLVDMRAPGVRVRPIRQITGEDDYNEVFIEDVAVPVENLVGAENGGWAIAMAAAAFERGTYFLPRIARMQVELENLVRLAQRRRIGSRPAIEHPEIRDRIGRLAIDVHVLRLDSGQMLEQAMRGAPPGVEGSAVKLLWSEAHQRLLDLAMDVLGPAAQFGPQEAMAPAEGRWQRDYLWTRAETILAGTSEIQRTLVAERGLGLPR